MGQPGKPSKDERHKNYLNSIVMQYNPIQVSQSVGQANLEIETTHPSSVF